MKTHVDVATRNMWMGIMKGSDPSEDLGIYGRILLKSVRKYDGRA
jgi:hypothetical protein